MDSGLILDNEVAIIDGGGIALQTVLDSQGFSSDNGWTIALFNLEGNLRLDTYTAFAGTSPAIDQGIYSFPEEDVGFSGGAAIGLRYLPQELDPVGANVHWIQFIYTNDPLDPTLGYDAGNDYRWYIDNFGRLGSEPAPDAANPYSRSPFYDDGGAANATDFVDKPTRGYDSDTVWRGYLFLATGDTTTKTLTISNQGITYGFNDPFVVASPEPHTLALAFMGTTVLLLLGKRPKRESSPN